MISERQSEKRQKRDKSLIMWGGLVLTLILTLKKCSWVDLGGAGSIADAVTDALLMLGISVSVINDPTNAKGI